MLDLVLGRFWEMEGELMEDMGFGIMDYGLFENLGNFINYIFLVI